jgi:hypothetical protein
MPIKLFYVDAVNSELGRMIIDWVETLEKALVFLIPTGNAGMRHIVP